MLQKQIHKITGIPNSALQRFPLTQFNVEERLSWNVHRHTKLEEDRVYLLLSIFNAYISPFYREEVGSALGRLKEEINKRNKCIKDLRLTNPHDNKQRIKITKSSLLKILYC